MQRRGEVGDGKAESDSITVYEVEGKREERAESRSGWT